MSVIAIYLPPLEYYFFEGRMFDFLLHWWLPKAVHIVVFNRYLVIEWVKSNQGIVPKEDEVELGVDEWLGFG